MLRHYQSLTVKAMPASGGKVPVDSQLPLLSRAPDRTRVTCLTQIMPWFEQQRQSGWGSWNGQDPELHLAPQSGAPLEPSNAFPAFSFHLATRPSSSTTQTLPRATPVTSHSRGGQVLGTVVDCHLGQGLAPLSSRLQMS